MIHASLSGVEPSRLFPNRYQIDHAGLCRVYQGPQLRSLLNAGKETYSYLYPQRRTKECAEASSMGSEQAISSSGTGTVSGPGGYDVPGLARLRRASEREISA